MEVHFQCTIQICRYQCPDQCTAESGVESHDASVGAGAPLDIVHLRDERAPNWYTNRRSKRSVGHEVGVNRVIKVVSTGDLTFSLDDNASDSTNSTLVFPAAPDAGIICMTTPGFAATLIVLFGILIASSLLSALLCIRLKPSGKSIK